MKGKIMDTYHQNKTTQVYSLAAKTLSYLDSRKQFDNIGNVRKEELYRHINDLRLNGTSVFSMLKMMGYIHLSETHISRTDKRSPWEEIHANVGRKPNSEVHEIPKKKVKWFTITKVESKLLKIAFAILFQASETSEIIFHPCEYSSHMNELIKQNLMVKLQRETYAITAAGKTKLEEMTLNEKISSKGLCLMYWYENCDTEDGSHIVYAKIRDVREKYKVSINAPYRFLNEHNLAVANPYRLTDKGYQMAKELKERYGLVTESFKLLNDVTIPQELNIQRTSKVFKPEYLILSAFVDNSIYDARGHHIVAYNRETIGKIIGKTRLVVQDHIDDLVAKGYIERSGRNKLYILQNGLDMVADSKHYIRNGIPNAKVFSSYFNAILFMLQHTTNCYDFKMVTDSIPSTYNSAVNRLIEDGIVMKVGTHCWFTPKGYEVAMAAKTSLKV